MGKTHTIDSFFKKKHVDISQLTPEPNVQTSLPNLEPDVQTSLSTPEQEQCSLKSPRIEVRRAYINYGPYQYILPEYPLSGSEKHPRHFQSSWFKIFSSWSEYSLSKDAAFCLPCYLFNKKGEQHGKSTFSRDGFNSWKKVRNGMDCAFLNHVGKDPNSLHKIAQKSCDDLMNQSQHIQRVIKKQTSEQCANNRLQLKASIDLVRYLTLQGLALRGRDESKSSTNRGNFLELINFFAEYNENVANVVLDRAPQNASNTSSQVQKEILLVYSMKIRKAICEEIGDAKFYILVDETRDQSKREQMAIVIRFVDKDGFIRERFFGLVHVSDTMVLTLKNKIFSTLSRYDLDLHNIQGQGYDEASNMVTSNSC